MLTIEDWCLFLSDQRKEDIERDVPEDTSRSAEKGELDMLVHNRFDHAEDDEYNASDEEREHLYSLLLDVLESEERHLCIHQIAAEERQSDEAPTHPIIGDDGDG